MALHWSTGRWPNSGTPREAVLAEPLNLKPSFRHLLQRRISDQAMTAGSSLASFTLAGFSRMLSLTSPIRRPLSQPWITTRLFDGKQDTATIWDITKGLGAILLLFAFDEVMRWYDSYFL